MKVALLISGYLRNYEPNLNFIQKKIVDKFDNVDVYLHITKNENSEDKYFNLIDEEKDFKKITSALSPTVTLIENNVKYSDNTIINGIANQWNKLYKLNKLKQINESTSGVEYDLVIRYRPDLSINNLNILDFDITKNTIYIPKDSKIDKPKLKYYNDGYLCDALAFGPSKLMDLYFNIYTRINELIEKYGSASETLLYYYLKDNNISHTLVDIDYSFILSKCNVFAICGDSGSGKSTLSKILKESFFDSFTLECDRYHKWERHNENWGKLTHLNPDANYITKMNEDIFNLKLGKEIFQVDYNHENGKFTEKQLINPSNNLIVCGLHSLYDKNSSSVYDIKIFMDTDETLKKKWKIKRDVTERGHSVEKILDSIKKREDDFKEYILPQKNNADVIVNFFSNDDIDLNDLNHVENLSLKLSIHKKFEIKNILSTFTNQNINYSVDNSDENFIKIEFLEYKPINLFGDDTSLNTNTFYDYIKYFIFNLIFTN